MAQGVQIVLATGKTFWAARQLVSRLGLTTPGIYLQGTAIYNSDGSIRSQQTLSAAIARQVITFAEDRGYILAIYSGGRVLVRKNHPRMDEMSSRYHEPEPEAVGPLQNVLDGLPINKLIAASPNDSKAINALRWHLSMQINGSARLMQAGVHDMMEILPPGMSKGAALKLLLKELKVSAEHVLAIGDAENDVEMLQLAGTGVAVGNATDHVKAVADAVVAGNDADGVAEAIEKYVLPIEQPAPAVVAVAEAKATEIK
jgi:Cof subfamily protein (haloacid dehalogenase superfamily)